MEEWQSWKEGGRGRTELIYVQESLDQKGCVDGGGGEVNAEGAWRGKNLGGGIMIPFLAGYFIYLSLRYY